MLGAPTLKPVIMGGPQANGVGMGDSESLLAEFITSHPRKARVGIRNYQDLNRKHSESDT